jgi:hypothetical protein
MADDIPTVERTATMQIGNLVLTVHHLSNGQRVIPAEDMARFVDWLENGGREMKDVTPRG